MWRLALTLDYDGVDDYVRARASLSCMNEDWQPPEGQMTAVLGDDGRYHLVRDEVVLCTEVSYSEQTYAALGPIPRAERALDNAAREARGKELGARITQLEQRFAAQDRERHGGRVPHERRCSWWTDGTTYRSSAPKTVSPKQRFAPLEQQVWWAVRLLNDPVDPSTVPPSRRCVFGGGRSVWPPYLSGESRMGRIRQQLVDLAGPLCHACGRTIGVVVDHDHFTGLVRGLLCWACNTSIDECPHLDGCPRADYLNDPPAGHLRVRYPLAHRDREHNRARIEYLGIDPFPPTRPYHRGQQGP
ncbi:Recombination endonuclease VII [Prauserella marina]|uniref:Recombination endonuclease VII n=1 Tax=Prauserella marina TaxID=530584 RepID=A0A1G6Z921_9PSEU|nr:recombination endonuclease VII [Prauserella marina]SDD98276.1 Recombination endonuclease VII [Prauserella marina]